MNEPAQWDAELAERLSPAPLFQSWAWGDVQGRAGWRIERVHLDVGAIASVQLRGVGPLQEAYVPRGPVPADARSIESLLAWSRARKIARLRVEPAAPEAFATQLAQAGFTPATPTQPQYTRIVPLRPREELMATFTKARRYNIRTGEKRGVTVEIGADAAELARQTAAVEEREGINLPSREYYELLLKELAWCRTYVARHPDTKEALSTVLVAVHDGRAYNLFAGRSGQHTELNGNDVAYWVAMGDCIDAGCRDLDLCGTAPPGAGPEHPWHGLSAFKAQFGGEEVAYCGPWEIVLSEGSARLFDLEARARQGIRRLRRNIS